MPYAFLKQECLHSIFMERPIVRLLYLTSEHSKPSVERDLNFIGYDDIITSDSETDHYHKLEAKLTNSEIESNLALNMFKINLSRKVTKKNGTMYLAVFSVPITDDTISQGNITYRKIIESAEISTYKTPFRYSDFSLSRLISDVVNNWKKQIAHADTTYTMVKLTQHHVPEAKTFNLLGADGNKNNSSVNGSLFQPDNKGKHNLHPIYTHKPSRKILWKNSS